MREFLSALILLALGTMAGNAQANTGIVRGGEHGSFTRLTIASEQAIENVENTSLGAAKFQLVSTPAFSKLNTSLMFDRLSADRVAAIRVLNTALELQVNCTCDIETRVETNNLLVIDIFESPETETVALPLLPFKSGAFPELPEAPAQPSPTSDAFALDFSAVDRLSKSIATQISQNSHIAGFSDIPMRLRDGENQVAELDAPPSSSIEGIDGLCQWSEAVWSVISTETPDLTGIANGGRSAGSFNEDTIFDHEVITRRQVVDFLSHGLLEEARATFKLIANPSEDAAEFSKFIAAVSGSAPEVSGRFGSCDPLFDILLAATTNEADIPGNIKLQILQDFELLSPGLQIQIYPRLNTLLGGEEKSLFPELLTHVNLEESLAQRKTSLEGDKISDPDSLAAVTTELRGTEREVESWEAAFNAYLDHNRFFDALASLQDSASLPPQVRELAVSKLIESLVDHAGSATFVQVAMTSLRDLDPSIDAADARKIVDRLIEEGFSDEARRVAEFLQLLPFAAPNDARSDARASTRTDDTTLLNSQDALAGSSVSPEQLSVAIAQDQLDQSSRVREALEARYAD